MKKTITRFGFRSKTQAPLFMVWQEEYINGELDYARDIFSFGYPKAFRSYRTQKMLDVIGCSILIVALSGFITYMCIMAL